MKEDLRKHIDEFGFAAVCKVFDDNKIEHLISILADYEKSIVVRKRSGTAYGIRDLLNVCPGVGEIAESPRVKSLVENILGREAKPVRAIFFDKTSSANWKVPPHQDLTVTVKEKRETENFTAWTRKAGIQHVQPPVGILEKMLAVRIHLDDADETNGALKVVPKSHRNGRLTAAEILNIQQTNKLEVCRHKRGDVFLMRPLLVHSSSSGTSPKHRRVVHIEYSAENLPNGLEWYES